MGSARTLTAAPMQQLLRTQSAWTQCHNGSYGAHYVHYPNRRLPGRASLLSLQLYGLLAMETENEKRLTPSQDVELGTYISSGNDGDVMEGGSRRLRNSTPYEYIVMKRQK